jgi:hypothetical protein
MSSFTPCGLAIEPPKVVKDFAVKGRQKVVDLLNFLLKENALMNLVPSSPCIPIQDEKALKQELLSKEFPFNFLDQAVSEFKGVTMLCEGDDACEISEENVRHLMPDKCEVMAQILYSMAKEESLPVRISLASFKPDESMPNMLIIRPPGYLLAPHRIVDGRIKHSYVEIEVDGQWWAVDVLSEGFGDSGPVIWNADMISLRNFGMVTERSRSKSNLRTKIAAIRTPEERMIFALNPTEDGSSCITQEFEQYVANKLALEFL